MDTSLESDGREAWAEPAWLEACLVPDRRFARAYESLGDRRRALLKGVIARHYALNPPPTELENRQVRRFGLFTQTRSSTPAPFVLLLSEPGFDSPALLLAALLPALCARVGQVLVARMGAKSDIPDAFLAACELSGQERLAALGPVQLERLLVHCAQNGQTGLVLHPDTPSFRAILSRKALRKALDDSVLRFVGLRPPQSPGVWREEPASLPTERLALLYGGLSFEEAGPKCVPQGFWEKRRDLLILPDALADKAMQGGAARLAVTEACLGQYHWPELGPHTFQDIRQGFGAAR
jgi:hypothetical protein